MVDEDKRDPTDTTHISTTGEDVLAETLDAMESRVVQERKDAGIAGNVDDRAAVQQVQPDHQAPS